MSRPLRPLSPWPPSYCLELIAPSGTRYPLVSREGDEGDAIDYTFTHDLSAETADGLWKLSVLDNGPYGTGTFDSWVLNLDGERLPSPAPCGGLSTTDFAIPELATIESPITVAGCDRAPSATSYIEVRIPHANERDLGVHLIAPDGERVTLQLMYANSQPDIFGTYIRNLSDKRANGVWKLMVEDLLNGSEEGGRLDSWKLTF